MRVCVSVCVCVSVRARMPTLLHGPGCNVGEWYGMPLVVHYWADLQSVHTLRCYGNTRNAWQSPAIRQANRAHYACRRRLPSPAIKSTHLQRGRSISSILRGVATRTRNVSQYMLVLAICLVSYCILFFLVQIVIVLPFTVK